MKLDELREALRAEPEAAQPTGPVLVGRVVEEVLRVFEGKRIDTLVVDDPIDESELTPERAEKIVSWWKSATRGRPGT